MKTKMKSKLFAMLLSLTMVVAVMPSQAFAGTSYKFGIVLRGEGSGNVSVYKEVGSGAWTLVDEGESILSDVRLKIKATRDKYSDIDNNNVAIATSDLTGKSFHAGDESIPTPLIFSEDENRQIIPGEFIYDPSRLSQEYDAWKNCDKAIVISFNNINTDTKRIESQKTGEGQLSCYLLDGWKTTPARRAREGDTIVVSAEPQSGWTLSGLYLLEKGADAPSAPYEITSAFRTFAYNDEMYQVAMPYYDAKVYAVFTSGDTSGEKHTVTFYDEDETTVLQTGDWEEGSTPVYSGQTPTKPADAQNTYTFAGWNPAITTVTGNATYTATYTATPIPVTTYTVTVINDGNGTGTANPTSGTQGTQVTLSASPNSGYKFKEWQVVSGGVTVTNDKFTIGTADVVLKATFELIPPDDISTATVIASDQTYDGTEKKPVPIVTWNGRTLTEGTDYDVTAYAGNKDAGDATVTVTGKGNFTGTANGTFKIAPAKATITVDNASKVEGASDPVFTGKVEGLIADGDLGDVTYSRTGGDEAPGSYKGVIIVNYTDNPNYDVTVTNGDFTITQKSADTPTYKAVSGSGGTYTKGSGKTLAFTYKRYADDGTTFSHFKGITVDGKAVPEKDASGKANWTAKSGSVIIELQSSYLETLSVGEHKLAVQFDDGADATSTFTMKAKPATPTVTPTKTPTKAATTSGKATTTAPKTGDESNMLLWFMLICASLFVMFRIISLRNRRFYDR